MSAVAVQWMHDETRRPNEHTHDESVHSRHARIRVDQASRAVNELADNWPKETNILEYVLLRRRLEAERTARDE